jgi:uncharacterized membrane protein
MISYLEKTGPLRFYHKQSDINQVLLLSCLFSTALSVFRVIYTGHLLFIFLNWNLFLAFVPYVFSGWIVQHHKKKKGWIVLLATAAWLFFVPNAFYIITDLFHLDRNESVPLWFDLALLLSFAWNGLLFGMLSVRQMEKLATQYFEKEIVLLLLFLIFFLNGLGVYIGRYLRFNSWDIVASPFQLLQDIVYLCIHPIRNRFDWSMIFCYSVLITLIYFSTKRLGKVLQ